MTNNKLMEKAKVSKSTFYKIKMGKCDNRYFTQNLHSFKLSDRRYLRDY